jgi:hypothetical protein
MFLVFFPLILFNEGWHWRETICSLLIKHMDQCGCGARSQYVVSARGQDKLMTDKLAHCYGRVNVWADLDLIGHIFQLETSSDIKKGILGRTEDQTPQFG